MSSILKIKDVNKNFGKISVLNDININIDKGDFLVLVGPSGCGKSTLLNCIAGLEKINGGEISINNKDMSEVAPKDRDIAMVFQSYALYPTMTVEKNITFGMKVRGISEEIQKKKLNEVAKQLQIENLLKRKPSQLSGGQRQRVAMGRALVRNPKIFLFDEPLSNLDAKLRIEMRREIKKLHKNLKTTMVYVTHDQTEAMSLGTKIAIMNNGKIEQFDTPSNIYNKPNSIFVADFVGSPSMNFIKGSLIKKDGKSSFLPLNGKEVNKIDLICSDLNITNNSEVFFGIRPEHIFLKKEHAARVTKDENFSEIKVRSELHEYIGHEQIITFNYLGQEILGKFASSIDVQMDVEISLFIDLNNISIFDSVTNKRL
jgi:multiple sugar transport system ATP-binding protein